MSNGKMESIEHCGFKAQSFFLSRHHWACSRPIAQSFSFLVRKVMVSDSILSPSLSFTNIQKSTHGSTTTCPSIPLSFMTAVSPIAAVLATATALPIRTAATQAIVLSGTEVSPDREKKPWKWLLEPSSGGDLKASGVMWFTLRCEGHTSLVTDMRKHLDDGFIMCLYVADADVHVHFRPSHWMTSNVVYIVIPPHKLPVHNA